MRKGGGKQKGAAFEREVCVALSRWISDGKQDDVFWRSAMSGGRSTVASKSGKRLAAQAGDLSCIHPIGHKFADAFHVEIKFYKDLDYVGLITGKGHLIEFWHETLDDAQTYHKYPLLIAKQNRIPAVVCLSKAGSIQLEVNKRLLIVCRNEELGIIPFYEFLKIARRLV